MLLSSSINNTTTSGGGGENSLSSIPSKGLKLERGFGKVLTNKNDSVVNTKGTKLRGKGLGLGGKPRSALKDITNHRGGGGLKQKKRDGGATFQAKSRKSKSRSRKRPTVVLQPPTEDDTTHTPDEECDVEHVHGRSYVSDFDGGIDVSLVTRIKPPPVDCMPTEPLVSFGDPQLDAVFSELQADDSELPDFDFDLEC